MKFSARLLLVLAIAVLMMIFFGCSSDDNGGTNSTGKTPGDDMNLNYLLFKSLIFSIDNTNIDRIRDLFDMYQAAAGPKSAAAGPVYHADSKYWYIEFADTTYYGYEISRDSIQFLQSGVAVQIPDSALLTEVKGGCYWLLLDTSAVKIACDLAQGDTLTKINLTCDVIGAAGQIAGAGDVTISIGGTFHGLPPGMSSDCDWNANFTVTGNNLPINLDIDNCPQSGEIIYSGTMVMACPAPIPSYSNSWTAKQTFNDGSVSWHIENENNYWDTDGYCMWYLD